MAFPALRPTTTTSATTSPISSPRASPRKSPRRSAFQGRLLSPARSKLTPLDAALLERPARADFVAWGHTQPVTNLAERHVTSPPRATLTAETRSAIKCPLTGRVTHRWASVSGERASGESASREDSFASPPAPQGHELWRRPQTREGDYEDDLDWRRAHSPSLGTFEASSLPGHMTSGGHPDGAPPLPSPGGAAEEELRLPAVSPRGSSSKYTTPVWRFEAPVDPVAIDRLYHGEKAPPPAAKSPRRRRRQARRSANDQEEMHMTYDEVAKEWERTASLQSASTRLARRLWLVAHYPHLRDEVRSMAAKHRRDRGQDLVVDFLKRNASPENFTREGLEKQRQRREAARAQHEARCAAIAEAAAQRKQAEREGSPMGGSPDPGSPRVELEVGAV